MAEAALRKLDSPVAHRQSLGSVDRRHHRHDGHREPAVCLDPVHQTHTSSPARLPDGRSGGRSPLFILVETWLVPVRRLSGRPHRSAPDAGHRRRSGRAWAGSGSGYAESMRSLYLWYMLGGVGAGVVYGGTIGNALKWFPDHRGLCVGLHRRRLWHRHGAHRRAHRHHDQDFRLPAHFHHLGHHPGGRCGGRGAVPGQAPDGLGAARTGSKRKRRSKPTCAAPRST